MAVRRRTVKLASKTDFLEDLDFILVNLDGLSASHPIRTAKTRMTLISEPDRCCLKIIKSHQAHEHGLYMVHGPTVICALTFVAQPAVIHTVDCHTAYGRVRPRSYVLFYKMAQLLLGCGVSTVKLQVTHTQFYRSIGFNSDGVADVSNIIEKTRRVFH
jgi:hypothetical protein